MRAVCFTVLALATIALTNPRPVEACSCIQITVEQSYEKSVAVFLGRVVKTELRNPNRQKSYILRRAGDYVVATLEVYKAWKGELDSLVEIKTGLHNCGIQFASGNTYLVYATKSNNELTTGVCHLTKHFVSADQDLKILDEKYPIRKRR